MWCDPHSGYVGCGTGGGGKALMDRGGMEHELVDLEGRK